jgi:hypothetical protein
MKNNKTKIKYFIISVFLLLFCLQVVSALPYYYNVSLYYNSGNLEINNINIIHSDLEISSNSGDYLVKILDNENNLLSENHFQVPLVEIYEVIDNDTGELTSQVNNLDEAFFNIYVHYNYGEEMIILDRDNNQLEDIKINNFLNTEPALYNQDTGNNLETGLNGSSSSDTKPNLDNQNNLLLVTVLVFILIVIILIFYLIKKKSK